MIMIMENRLRGVRIWDWLRDWEEKREFEVVL